MYAQSVVKRLVYNKFSYHIKRTILNLYFLFLMYLNFIIYNSGINMQYKRRHRDKKALAKETLNVTIAISPFIMVYWIL